VVDPKLLLELLVGLFTDPPGLDRGSERLDGGIGRQALGHSTKALKQPAVIA